MIQESESQEAALYPRLPCTVTLESAALRSTAAGHIKGYRRGNTTLVKVEELSAYIEGLEDQMGAGRPDLRF